MAPLIFMSPEHVARMNELLAESASVRDACAELDRDYEIAGELRDGPEGTVHWVIRLDRKYGASMSLDPPRAADLTYLGDWSTTIREAKAAREGRRSGPIYDLRGDPTTMTRVSKAYAAAQAVATIRTEFPMT